MNTFASNVPWGARVHRASWSTKDLENNPEHGIHRGYSRNASTHTFEPHGPSASTHSLGRLPTPLEEEQMSPLAEERSAPTWPAAGEGELDGARVSPESSGQASSEGRPVATSTEAIAPHVPADKAEQSSPSHDNMAPTLPAGIGPTDDEQSVPKPGQSQTSHASKGDVPIGSAV